jgi:hypothetical protein
MAELMSPRVAIDPHDSGSFGLSANGLGRWDTSRRLMLG